MHNHWQAFLKTYSPHHPLDDATHHLVNLSDYGLLKVSGTDAKKLLQGQLTCQVDEVTATQARMGAHCNPQGRVISLFYLIQMQHSYYLLMPRAMVAVAMTALKKYAVFYKTQLTDESDNAIIIGYASLIKPAVNTSLINITNITNVTNAVSGGSRYILVGELEPMKTIWEELAKHTPISTLSTWKLLTIRDGIPTIYPETTGKFLPHEINLHELGAIHFDKGCYTGQEIIARMHYRGKLKKHMYQASIASESLILPGSDIYSLQGLEMRSSGIVVDASPETYNNYQALIVTEESNAKNNNLFLDRDSHAFFKVK
jgi:tRNA-modifying protein YgfZ